MVDAPEMRTGIPMLHLCVHEKGGGAEAYLHFMRDQCAGMVSAKGHTLFNIASLEGLGAHPPRLSAIWGLRRFLHQRPEPVFFLYGQRAQLLAAYLAPRGKKLVGMIHGEIDFEGRKTQVRRLYEKRMDYWVANSRAVLDRRNGCVVENALFHDASPWLPELRPAPRYDYGVLASGNALKGHRFLIELWRAQPGLGKLCFAGNLPEELKRDAAKAGIDCLGFVKPFDFFSDIRMLIHPSVSESMPNAIIEALGFGIPVLANPAGGIPDILGEYAPEMVLPRAAWKKHLGTMNYTLYKEKALSLAPRIRERFHVGKCMGALQRVCHLLTNSH
jgi:glycosyltransferase involved in cell wall biosynthesis